MTNLEKLSTLANVLAPQKGTITVRHSSEGFTVCARTDEDPVAYTDASVEVAAGCCLEALTKYLEERTAAAARAESAAKAALSVLTRALADVRGVV